MPLFLGKISTYYILDPQGVPLAIYTSPSNNNTLTWEEQYVYSVSRLSTSKID
ncbi:hypothetical protein LX64_02582 [Chitinophaga skermanii]|uniref:Uncharacterized protein n=1 Tax=Chitinophaga skermanii TaxID=331697 RepID=A0A327QP01_9BACT|nr:hypothetical protein LX64_02582 [Chitinophaga skermanii]